MRIHLLLSLILALTSCGSTSAKAPTAPAQRPSGSYFADFQGTRVHYLDSGGSDVEALVLIHGWASSTVAWKHQFPDWSSRARTLVVDLPGHGGSEPPAGGYSFAVFADAVAAVMSDANVARGVIVGHSNGTPVALSFSRRHPERTLALVGIDGALKNDFTREQVEPMFAPLRGDEWQSVLSNLIEGMAGALGEEDREAIKGMALGTPHEAVVGGMEAVFLDGAWSDAPIHAPLLLVLAKQPIWNEAYEAWVRNVAPQVDYIVWEGVGHYLQMERPGELRAALEAFMEANELL